MQAGVAMVPIAVAITRQLVYDPWYRSRGFVGSYLRRQRPALIRQLALGQNRRQGGSLGRWRVMEWWDIPLVRLRCPTGRRRRLGRTGLLTVRARAGLSECDTQHQGGGWKNRDDLLHDECG